MLSVPQLFRLSIRSTLFAVGALLVFGLAFLSACGKSDAESDSSGTQARSGRSSDGRSSVPGRGGRGGPPGRPGRSADMAGDTSVRGVPVELRRVERRPIALFFETQGTLEAENEVDLTARLGGPVLELHAEQGERVRQGELLAKIDDREIKAQLDVAEVRLSEAKQSYERVRKLHEQDLISRDAYDQALASYEAAQGERERLAVQLEYTRITAPFDGLVAERYVRLAQMVQNGSQLFRLVDFDPLLVPIRVPERELPRLRLGQQAELRVEAYGERRFGAEVLRMSPVVDPASGTVEVTLEVNGEAVLRPGMFASVFLEMDRRSDALVVPKAALALDSLGSTMYVVRDGAAQRRDLTIGFRNDDLLEVVEGVEAGEMVVIVGQDGLADGTPVDVIEAQTLDGEPVEGFQSTDAEAAVEDRFASGSDQPGAAGRPPGGPGGGGRGGGVPEWLRDLDWNDETQVDRLRAWMRERGLSDSEIDQRIERMKQRFADGEGTGGGGR
ncbi:MAG: efflux RND transporter periplasmic adaptor subunit [Thermoanaerobaculia bacterium]|nr:efflux RND transporter periplasmic adaptor subunit [Thermoanaerobaculia bacterium]